MVIKTLEELRKLRASLQSKINLREKGEIEDNKLIEVLVCMSTCGIAAGARASFNKFLEVIDDLNLENVKILSVGCVTECHAEPTVQVNIPGQDALIFGEITEDIVKELVETVIIKHKLLDEKYLIKSSSKAVV